MGNIKINKYFKLKSRPVRVCQSVPKEIFHDQEMQESQDTNSPGRTGSVSSNLKRVLCKYVAKGKSYSHVVELACDKMHKSLSSCLLYAYIS